MELFGKPSFVRDPKPSEGHLIRNERAVRQLVIIPGKPSPDQPREGPVSDQRNEDQYEIAIAPAKPAVGRDAMAFLAAVGSIVDLGVTGRTVHGVVGDAGGT